MTSTEDERRTLYVGYLITQFCFWGFIAIFSVALLIGLATFFISFTWPIQATYALVVSIPGGIFSAIASEIIDRELTDD